MKKIFSLLFLSMMILWISYPLKAQNMQGREFWLAFLNHTGADDVKLFISTGATAAQVEVRLFDNATGTVVFTGNVAANTTQAVTLTPANVLPTTLETVQYRGGIRVTATSDVFVTASNALVGSLDATSVLPLPNLGKISEYYVTAYSGESQVMVVATEDNTEVKITPSTTTAGAKPAGTQFSVTLNRGQTYWVRSNAPNDLSGTIVEACRPIAVFAGTNTSTVTGACAGSNHLYAQMLPLAVWGQRFLTAPLESSSANYVLRFVASDNNTTISIDSATSGANFFTLNKGQVRDIELNKAVTIQSSTLVSVAMLMKSNSCNGASVGNPSLTILSPADRQLRSATFSTITRTGINSHSALMILRSSSTNATTLNIRLNGTLITTGISAFSPGRDYVFVKIPIPTATAAPYTLTANADFSLYVYGTSTNESYLTIGGTGFATSTNTLSAQTPICPNNPVTFSATGRNVATFDWYLTGDVNSLTTRQTVTPAAINTTTTTYTYTTPGTYNIRLIITTNAGCKDTLSTTITIRQPTPNFTIPYPLCPGDSATLDAGLYDAYLWSDGSTGRTLKVKQPGSYWIELTQGSCKQRTNFTVITAAPPQTDIVTNPVAPNYFDNNRTQIAYVCEKNAESFQLTALASYNAAVHAVVWSTPSGTQSSNTITINKAGSYSVIVTDITTGCRLADSVIFRNACETLLQLPTGFTPNDDGKNDVLEIFGDGFYNLDLRIFNRWGETIFVARSANDKWDGLVYGQKAPSGTYVWNATYESVFFPGQKLKAQGKINLLR
ncbi:MAG: gliding motility-associated C-terminal domain-containing protein [Cytophagales bacterium]|nr:MAG: gliding motility-associated C-terminal domain-containing protein [Cytophagales bacterium]